jgi:beta-mannosidase
MREILLNGLWKFKILGENVYKISEEYMAVKVPGSVYGVLLEAGKIPNLHYRDNEIKALKLMENDFEYICTFQFEEEVTEQNGLLLRFEGVDTLADLYLNGKFLGDAYNMHRIWEYDIKDVVRQGVNELKLTLYSPTNYIKSEQKKCYVGGSHESMEGFPHLRKAHCMFGWDWGPRLPDAGIFRDVKILVVNEGRIEQVYIKQTHSKDCVILEFDYSIDLYNDNPDLDVVFTVYGPDGKCYNQEDNGDIIIHNPDIWWPRGYGEQPLYWVKGELRTASGTVIDIWERRIGLRTLTVHREKDQWGESFAHEVNGIQIFAMGADYIPEDNLLGRVTKERTRQLLFHCVEANYNTIRVWGGGYYPDDFFFDICDELGILVWMDFMFACASYELNEDFEENIRQEIIDNVIRLRHHACLALWCGNNELETQVQDKAWRPSQKQYYDYLKIFEYIIPNIVKEYDPQTFYWPSSPSSGGNFDDSWNYNKGDTHYWDVWHGNKPFSEYRKYFFRYASEFGFQSFPSMKTIESFTIEKDRNIFSRVMEMHQRNKAANGKILAYIADNYLYPKDFEHLIYTSQLLQADAIRYGVEHWRRNRGRCMGAIVWQLNDIWPVASWSSIDYFGRWKALHYAEKRFFAPILISCEEIGEMTKRPHCIEEPHEIEKSARLNVANETRNAVEGVISWALRNPRAEVISSGSEKLLVPPLSSVWIEKLDFSNYDELNHYFSYEYCIQEKVVSQGVSLFTAPKHFEFLDPELEVVTEDDSVIVTSKAFAKNVEIYNDTGDLILSDNFFDMHAEERHIKILKGSGKKLKVRSVYNID